MTSVEQVGQPQNADDGPASKKVSIAILALLTAVAGFLDGTTKAITSVQSVFNAVSLCNFVGGEIQNNWHSHVPGDIDISFHRSGCTVTGYVNEDRDHNIPAHEFGGSYDTKVQAYILNVTRHSVSKSCTDTFEGKFFVIDNRTMFSVVTDKHVMGCGDQPNLSFEARYWTP